MVALNRRALMRAAAAGTAFALAGCDKLAPQAAAPPFQSYDITGADYARGFSLPDGDGQLRTLADFKGKVVVVFFGYTQCPDFCPTTLQELVEIKRSLGENGKRVQVVFITVDPERDTPALVKAYAANFGPDVVGLRGTPEQVREHAKQFKTFFAKSPGKTEGSYTVEHDIRSYVFDPQGRVRLVTRPKAGPKALAEDIQRLLAETN